MTVAALLVLLLTFSGLAGRIIAPAIPYADLRFQRIAFRNVRRCFEHFESRQPRHERAPDPDEPGDHWVISEALDLS